MNQLSRREPLKSAGLLVVTPQLGAALLPGAAPSSAYEWIRCACVLIAETYNPPFYPSLDYEPEKVVRIEQELSADSLRHPAASYHAYSPAKSGYPVHPELRGDPMRQTVDSCRKASLKNVAYVSLNHFFTEVTSKDGRFAGWSKKLVDGRAMTTEYYEFVEYYEGCLNSPVRDVIKALVREVLVDYPFDAMYFDGPYQGMESAQNYCHCTYCDMAYRKGFLA